MIYKIVDDKIYQLSSRQTSQDRGGLIQPTWPRPLVEWLNTTQRLCAVVQHFDKNVYFFFDDNIYVFHMDNFKVFCLEY